VIQPLSFEEKMTNTILRAGIAALGIAGAAYAQCAPTVNVTADIAVSTTWTPANIYNLKNQIYVLPGATLTIAAGTIIASDGLPVSPEGGGIAVTRGAKIVIQGTETNPVVMTSSADLATWTACDQRTGTWRAAANEWGNLTIMGSAYTNTCVGAGAVSPTFSPANFSVMEGLAPPPAHPEYAWFGGGNDDDDSGSISYLSIRYGGKVIGLGNELNGLSLGGVGRETDIHHVEIMNNVDDGVEIWGGTVNLKYLSIWNIGDDSFDVDQGWRGCAQFGLIVQGYSLGASQGSGVGDNAIEVDGAEFPDYQPVTTALVANFTVIGQPNTAGPPALAGGDHLTAFRDNARVQFHRCIFMDAGDEAIRFDNTAGSPPSEPCSGGYGLNGTLDWATTWTTAFNAVPAHANDPVGPRSTWYPVQYAGNLIEFKDNVFWSNLAASAYTTANARGVFAAGNNNVLAASSPIQVIVRDVPTPVGPTPNIMERVLFLDPRPANDALTSVAFEPFSGTFTSPSKLDGARYRGAFAPGNTWLKGWTASEAFGLTASEAWTDIAGQVSGLNGYPVLSGTGTMIGGTNISVDLTNARPSSSGVILIGASKLSFPFFGGILVPNAVLNAPFVTSPTGTFFLGPVAWPVGVPAGINLYWQEVVSDAAAPFGLAFSNALVSTTP
jgi:hypothetical protein